MELINYNYGYMPKFNCSIHGKIVATKEEWLKAIKYLSHHKVLLYYGSDMLKKILLRDLDNYYETKAGTSYCIRVTATQLIVKKFSLGKYKAGNYMFLVTN